MSGARPPRLVLRGHPRDERRVNRQVRSLHRFSTLPSLVSGWRHSSTTKAMAKWTGGRYVFADRRGTRAPALVLDWMRWRRCEGHRLARAGRSRSAAGRSATPSRTETRSTSTASRRGVLRSCVAPRTADLDGYLAAVNDPTLRVSLRPPSNGAGAVLRTTAAPSRPSR